MNTNPRVTLDNSVLGSRLRTQRLAPQSSYTRGATATRQIAWRQRYKRTRANPYQPVVVQHRVEIEPQQVYGLSESLKEIDNPPVRSTGHSRVLIAMASLLFIIGGGAGVSSILTNRSVAKAAQTVQTMGQSSDVLADGQVPDETELTEDVVAAHTAAPDAPKLLTIPSIQVKARVLPMATDKTGKLAAPRNIFDTGWFTESSKPGENGAMLIDGHASGLSKVGVFSRLKELKTGDVISVTRGDNRTYNYTVVNSKVFDDKNVDMNSAMVSTNTAKSGLNLITCTGNAKPNGDYDKRLIVYAVAR